MHTQKIATCSYCGARTILQLTARGGHELACASCGAPVHEMKPLRMDRSRSPGDRPKRRAPEGYIADIHGPRGGYAPQKRKKRKGGGLWRVLEEVADVVEDILD